MNNSGLIYVDATIMQKLKREVPDIFDDLTYKDAGSILQFNWRNLYVLGYSDFFLPESSMIKSAYENAYEWIIKNQWDIRFKLL